MRQPTKSCYQAIKLTGSVVDAYKHSGEVESSGMCGSKRPHRMTVGRGGHEIQVPSQGHD
jgi:hypothetical protein